MKAKRPNPTVNAAQIWKQVEDQLVPRLQLNVIDRAVYCHLLRHTHLEGRRRFHFSVDWLARGLRLSATPTRNALRRLAIMGALRILERSKAGHFVEVRLPCEIRAARDPERVPAVFDLEEASFMQTRALRISIHRREGGRCFYCLRELRERVQCLDHVVPRARLGRDGYRNLVSCCLECNSQKGQRTAGNFLRELYRLRRLNAPELAERLRALDRLARGKLKPVLAPPANPLPHKGRPRLYRAYPEAVPTRGPRSWAA
jgi:hypothetical protein